MIEIREISLCDLIWDDHKNRINIEKHGCSFEEAHLILNSFNLTFIDDKKDYGEIRYTTIGIWYERIAIVVYTMRDDYYRIISMRKANEREKAYYYAKIREIRFH